MRGNAICERMIGTLRREVLDRLPAPQGDAVAGEATDSAAAGQQPGARRQPGIEDAIHADERLTDDQKAALIAVYHSMLR